jgi:hypothetical protein
MPVSADEWRQAVADGAVDAETATRLEAYFAQRVVAESSPSDALAADPIDPDDENFRLVGGFSDIFVTIGLFLLLGAIVTLVRPTLWGVVVAVCAWPLAEIFTRRRRMRLPSLALAAGFICGAGVQTIALIDGHPSGAPLATGDLLPLAAPLAFIVGALAAAAHYWRFRVAFDVGAIAACPIAAVLSASFLFAPQLTLTLLQPLFLCAGVGVFALAMRYDVSDLQRRTHRADVAFWLHLTAAPMIVHGVLGAPGPLFRLIGDPSAPRALATLAAIFIFVIVALIVDRRALIVSGLSYAGVAIYALVSLGQSATPTSVGLALLFIGAMVLTLSVGWGALRRALLPHLPLGALTRFAPPATERA